MNEDEYTGNVQVGGPAQMRELDGITVRKLAVGPMSNNAYLLTCEEQGAQALIDPAAEPALLLELIRTGSGSAQLDLIFVTHRHPDHLGALESLAAVTGAEIAAGADDADSIQEQTGVHIQHRLLNGDVIRFGQCELNVIHLRGHTPGSIALALQSEDGTSHLFTGDSLFPGGVGKTNSPEEFGSLLNDVTTRLFDKYDDRTWVYPGHGNDTTLAAERPHLQDWRARGW